MDNEKNRQNLDVEDLDKVSGGYVDYSYDGTGHSAQAIHCDNCGCLNAVSIGMSNHLCISCMKKIKDELGDDALNAILKKS